MAKKITTTQRNLRNRTRNLKSGLKRVGKTINKVGGKKRYQKTPADVIRRELS